MMNTSIDNKRSYPIGRQRLSTVLQEANEVIETGDVVKTLSVTRIEASKLLSRWTGQGWLRRVGRGTYVPVPLDLLGNRYVWTITGYLCHRFTDHPILVDGPLRSTGT